MRYGGENVVGRPRLPIAHGSSGIGLLGDFSATTTTPEAPGRIGLARSPPRPGDISIRTDLRISTGPPSPHDLRVIPMSWTDLPRGQRLQSTSTPSRARVGRCPRPGRTRPSPPSSRPAIPCRSSSRPLTCAAGPALTTTSWLRSHGAAALLTITDAASRQRGLCLVRGLG